MGKLSRIVAFRSAKVARAITTLLSRSVTRLCLAITVLLLLTASTSAQIRLPQIDPTGQNVFVPGGSTTLLGPRATGNPLRQPAQPVDFSGFNPPTPLSTPVPPAFTPAAKAPDCNAKAPTIFDSKKHLIPDPRGYKTSGQRGQIIMTPSRIVAPVNSEVVVLAGICGGNGYFSINQPLEWMLSNDSVGQIIEVGGTEHSLYV